MANGAARVLVGLNREGRYTAEVKGNEVWIHITEKVAATGQANKGSNRQTQNAASAMIDFRKSGKGGVVDITLLPDFRTA